MVLSRGFESVSQLAKNVKLKPSEVSALLQDMSDVKVSLKNVAYSESYLQEWLDKSFNKEMIIDLRIKSAEKELPKKTLLLLLKKKKDVIFSTNQEKALVSTLLLQRMQEGLASKNMLDLQSTAKQLNLSIDDLLSIFRGDSRFILRENRYLVSQRWLIEELLISIKTVGKVVFSSFTDQWQLTGFTRSVFKELLTKEGIRGVYSIDIDIFIEEDFLRRQIMEASKHYTDIDFDTIAQKLDIPKDRVSEILIAAIDKKIVIGKIDRANQRFLVHEIPTTLSDQMLAGQPVTVNQIKQTYNKPTNACLAILREHLPSNNYVLTREKKIVQMEQIESSCQVCGTINIIQNFLKCEECGRDLCWDHFEEISAVGRPICPYCDGSLEFLPKYCEKCHIDYIRVTKSNETCEFCGYPLTIKDSLNSYYRKYLGAQQKPIEIKRAAADFSKETKTNK